MYRSVPGGLHDAGPNPQPVLPQRLHFCSSSSSLLRTYCFWPRLSWTIIRTHPPLLLFSRGLSQSKPWSSLFGSPAASFFGGPWLCVHPPHDGVALLAALLEGRCAYLVLLSASRESHANIISESPCLGAGLPLFTELPRRGILGNRASD
jgi:hypothetical protein